MKRLWEKGAPVDAHVYRFTIGEDLELDLKLVSSDIVASVAHAMMLRRVEVLSEEEEKKLVAALRSLLGALPSSIPAELEDGHTWIEHRLTEKLGATGEKIHTGRSRNDQVLAATRLYAREYTLRVLRQAVVLGRSLLKRAEENARVPFPGRTHTQLAMPFTLGMVFAAWGEQLVDDLQQLQTAYHLLNRSPLGSAAGYGVPLVLDRQYVSDLLGFSSLQNNVLAVQNSRGRVESALLNALEHIAQTLGNMAGDLIFYSLPDCSYLSLPVSLTTGSSIMPQKRNPDVLELVRGKSTTISAYAQRMRMVGSKLSSGYHRDFQETKDPLLRGLSTSSACLEVMHIVVESLLVNEQALRDSLHPELFATDEVYRKVRKGQSFRSAYREVAAHLDEVSVLSVEEFCEARRSQGAPGNPGFSLLGEALDALTDFAKAEEKRHSSSVARLAGCELSLLKS